MTWSELRDLVTALPEDSATKAAAAGDHTGHRWSQGTYLQATEVNLLQLIATTLWRAHLKGDPPEMTPVEPPQLEADERRLAIEEARAARNKAVLDRYAPSGHRPTPSSGRPRSTTG
ncbi:hypothetical protein [Streptomyces sp. QHH-9511]|uniref:hypothetical protein n=1 Tax=Streptomyces sp. QHH-9511 TaxID=2684468 RepID=UPI001E2FF8F4|nr:hypothetical protein [Streptomyces sp. QHH-9511]